MFRTRTLCTLLVCALSASAWAGEETPPPAVEPPAPRLTPGVARWMNPNAPVSSAPAEDDPELAGAVEEGADAELEGAVDDSAGEGGESGDGADGDARRECLAHGELLFDGARPVSRFIKGFPRTPSFGCRRMRKTQSSSLRLRRRMPAAMRPLASSTT